MPASTESIGSAWNPKWTRGKLSRELREALVRLHDPRFDAASRAYLDQTGSRSPALIELLRSRGVLDRTSIQIEELGALATTDSVLESAGWIFTETELALYALSYLAASPDPGSRDGNAEASSRR